MRRWQEKAMAKQRFGGSTTEVTHLIKHYEGIEDFLDHVSGPPGRGRSEDLSSRMGDYGFTNTESFDEAVQLLRGGWHEGLKRITELSDQITAAIGSPAPELVFTSDVAGGIVDIGAYMSGEPECMGTWHEDLGQHHIVHFTVNCSASAGISTQALLARGAVIAATIDALEAAGNRCVVDVANTVVSDWMFTQQVRIKDAQDPLDLERMAFAVAHPSMLRRLMFAGYEVEPRDVWGHIGTGGGYGVPHDLPKHMHGDVNIEKLLYDDKDKWNVEKAVAAAIGWMKEAGVELEGLEV